MSFFKTITLFMFITIIGSASCMFRSAMRRLPQAVGVITTLATAGAAAYLEQHHTKKPKLKRREGTIHTISSHAALQPKFAAQTPKSIKQPSLVDDYRTMFLLPEKSVVDFDDLTFTIGKRIKEPLSEKWLVQISCESPDLKRLECSIPPLPISANMRREFETHGTSLDMLLTFFIDGEGLCYEQIIVSGTIEPSETIVITPTAFQPNSLEADAYWSKYAQELKMLTQDMIRRIAKAHED